MKHKNLLICGAGLAILCILSLFLWKKIRDQSFRLLKWDEADINDPLLCGRLLDKYGAIALPSVVSPEVVERLRELTTSELNNPDNENSILHSHVNRENIVFPLTETVRETAKWIYKTFYPMWDRITPNPQMAECGVIITSNGALPQRWHADTYGNPGDQRLVTVGITLDDITEDMGPLQLFPGSNKYRSGDLERIRLKKNIRKIVLPALPDEEKYTIGVYEQQIPTVLEEIGYKRESATFPAGSIVMWDSLIYHRGGGSSSPNDRRVFYCSFLGSSPGKIRPDGSTYSLHSSIEIPFYYKSL